MKTSQLVGTTNHQKSSSVQTSDLLEVNGIPFSLPSCPPIYINILPKAFPNSLMISSSEFLFRFRRVQEIQYLLSIYGLFLRSYLYLHKWCYSYEECNASPAQTPRNSGCFVCKTFLQFQLLRIHSLTGDLAFYCAKLLQLSFFSIRIAFREDS
ncbi:hypothetical protein Ancab_000471 [Ancistrocladus abbreviatus]